MCCENITEKYVAWPLFLNDFLYYFKNDNGKGMASWLMNVVLLWNICYKAVENTYSFVLLINLESGDVLWGWGSKLKQ